MRRQVALASLLLAFVSMEGHAQPSPGQTPSSEQAKALAQTMMQASVSAILAAMGPMTEAVIESQLKLAANPETAERLAAFKRNLFEALIKKGFTAQEALQIVMATSPPSASPDAR